MTFERVFLWTLSVISIIAYTQIAFASDLRSSGLCRGQDLVNKQCPTTNLLRGDGIVINSRSTPRICLVSSYQTSEQQEITHVWFFNGARMPQDNPTVWLDETRSFMQNLSEQLDWLKSRNVGMASAIAAIVKLTVKPSLDFHTVSCKTLGKEWVGTWKAEIYDTNSPSALITYKFTVQ